MPSEQTYRLSIDLVTRCARGEPDPDRMLYPTYYLVRGLPSGVTSATAIQEVRDRYGIPAMTEEAYAAWCTRVRKEVHAEREMVVERQGYQLTQADPLRIFPTRHHIEFASRVAAATFALGGHPHPIDVRAFVDEHSLDELDDDAFEAWMLATLGDENTLKVWEYVRGLELRRGKSELEVTSGLAAFSNADLTEHVRRRVKELSEVVDAVIVTLSAAVERLPDQVMRCGHDALLMQGINYPERVVPILRAIHEHALDPENREIAKGLIDCLVTEHGPACAHPSNPNLH